MGRRELRAVFAQERGTALPLALLILSLLASLTTAFIAMSSTEPLIAANLKTTDQALSLAEAGVERARWALNNSTAPSSGLTSPLPGTMPSPYGGDLVALGTGAYQVTVSTGASANERTIVATGTALRNGATLPGSAPIPQADVAAQRVVQVTLQAPPSPSTTAGNLPGALSVGGSVQVSGNSSISGGSTTCGAKTGITTTDYPIACPTCSTNTVTQNGNASVTGSPSGTGTITNPQFAQYTFSASDLSALRALAQSSGTYIKPTTNSVSLTLGNGLTFVDTVNGQAFSGGSSSDPYSGFDQSADASKLPSVSIAGNNTGSGWLIVIGGLQMAGNSSYTGLIYAYNDFQASGNTHITGAIVSKNAVDTVATVIDTQTTGNSSITYSCDAVTTGGGYLPTGLTSPTFSLKAGTWRICPSVGSC